MEQPREYIEQLAAKLMASKLNEEEQLVLDDWINAQMQLQEYHFDADFASSKEHLKQRMLCNLLLRIEEEEFGERKQLVYEIPKETPVRSLASWINYAAAVLIFALGFSLYYYQSHRSKKYNETHYTQVLPGGNRATLTLADGTRIDLSDAQKGIVIGKDNIKYNDGSPIPNSNQSEKFVRSSAVTMLTLSTPKGGQYQVTLPDGSQVWLNSASTLRYPSRFSENERRVELEGEAYFEVEKVSGIKVARMPFIVKTAVQEVEVLGTQFNISAYSDEPDVKTTLVEGSVKLLANASGNSILLIPGEQGVLSKGKITKAEVDVNNFISWKSGRFSFDGKPFDQVMRELGRWYDLEIIYEGSIPEKSFYGEAFRSNNLSIVMKLLKSADVDYRLEGQKLIIRTKGKERSRN